MEAPITCHNMALIPSRYSQNTEVDANLAIQKLEVPSQKRKSI